MGSRGTTVLALICAGLALSFVVSAAHDGLLPFGLAAAAFGVQGAVLGWQARRLTTGRP